MEEVRGFQKRYVLISVFYVVAGLILLFWPRMSMDRFCTALGIALVVYGIANVIIYFAKDRMATIMQMELTVGVVSAAFGAYMLLHNEFTIQLLPFVIGVLLMTGGITKIQYTLDLKQLGSKLWKFILAAAILLLLLGAVLIWDPFGETVQIYYIGVTLIFEGVTNIISILVISGLMKKGARHMPPHGPEPGPIGPEGQLEDGKMKGSHHEPEIR